MYVYRYINVCIHICIYIQAHVYRPIHISSVPTMEISDPRKAGIFLTPALTGVRQIPAPADPGSPRARNITNARYSKSPGFSRPRAWRYLNPGSLEDAHLQPPDPQGPTTARPTRSQGGLQGPGGLHKNLAHTGQAGPTRARPTGARPMRAQGAHKALAHKGPGGPTKAGP